MPPSKWHSALEIYAIEIYYNITLYNYVNYKNQTSFTIRAIVNCANTEQIRLG